MQNGRQGASRRGFASILQNKYFVGVHSATQDASCPPAPWSEVLSRVRRGHGARSAELQPPAPGPSVRRSGRHPRWLSASAQVGAFGGTAAHFAVFAARSLLNMQLFTFSASKRKKLHVFLGLMAFHRHSDRSTRCPAVLATARPAVLPSWQPDDRPTHRPAVLQSCRPPFLPPVRRLRRPTQSSRPDRSRRSGRWTPARARPWRRRCPRAWCDSG